MRTLLSPLRATALLLGALVPDRTDAFSPQGTIRRVQSSAPVSSPPSWADVGSAPPRRAARRAALQVATSTEDFFDLLDDDKGHINPELAQRIWKWEKQQRVNLSSPDFDGYSTRQGLRWVKEIMILVGQTGGKTFSSSPSSASANYDDLTQEGVIALMQALKTFERESRPDQSFEAYAKAHIRSALEGYTLQHDNGAGMTAAGNGRTRNGRNDARSGSSSSTAGRRRTRPPLSVESTVEITDPLLETVEKSRYVNQDEWEVREGLVLDNGRSLRREELVEDFLDEMLQYEGEDQMWIHTQSVAAPLKDSIPDTSTFLEDVDDDAEFLLSTRSANNGLKRYTHDDETAGSSAANRRRQGSTSPDDMALTDMILYNVDDFLGKTLDELESQVIQMRFGLDDGIPQTQKEIALGLGLSVTKVRKLQQVALGKLRATFADKYVKDDTSHEDYWEDTV